MSLPTDAKGRKAIPVYSGFVKYFPDAMCAVAELSKIGNDQHNPGQPLHWDRSKSTDEADALQRHLLEHGTMDADGIRHSAKVAWRAMALLQKEIEAERGAPKSMMDCVRERYAPKAGAKGAVSDYYDPLHQRPDFVIPWEPPSPTDLDRFEKLVAQRAAHNADPTTRHGGIPAPLPHLPREWRETGA